MPLPIRYSVRHFQLPALTVAPEIVSLEFNTISSCLFRVVDAATNACGALIRVFRRYTLLSKHKTESEGDGGRGKNVRGAGTPLS